MFTELLKSAWRLKYDHKTHRLRCQGHILNLATQSFLFVIDQENLEDLADDGSNKYNITLAEIKKWRTKGPLGKLHNLVIFVQGSIQREQKYWDLSGDLRLVRNNHTRWNSWFMMIGTAINQREAINQFCDQYEEASMVDDILTGHDWEVLVKRLEPFLRSWLIPQKLLSHQRLVLILLCRIWSTS